MGKFLRNFVLLILAVVIALGVGMVSPGKKLSGWQQQLKKVYYQQIEFRSSEIAADFSTTPFDLRIEYLVNTEGNLEAYFINSEKNEILPIFEIEGTTQVGDVAHRFRGIGEEGRNKLRDALEGAREGSAGAIEKALQLLGK